MGSVYNAAQDGMHITGSSTTVRLILTMRRFNADVAFRTIMVGIRAALPQVTKTLPLCLSFRRKNCDLKSPQVEAVSDYCHSDLWNLVARFMDDSLADHEQKECKTSQKVHHHQH